jgi:hypothetical protein
MTSGPPWRMAPSPNWSRGTGEVDHRLDPSLAEVFDLGDRVGVVVVDRLVRAGLAGDRAFCGVDVGCGTPRRPKCLEVSGVRKRQALCRFDPPDLRPLSVALRSCRFRRSAPYGHSGAQSRQDRPMSKSAPDRESDIRSPHHPHRARKPLMSHCRLRSATGTRWRGRFARQVRRVCSRADALHRSSRTTASYQGVSFPGHRRPPVARTGNPGSGRSR